MSSVPPPPPPAQPPMQPPPPGYPQPAPYGQPYALPDAPNATLAMILGIIALVLSVLGCCGVFGVIPLGLGIAALILGIQARGKIAASPGMFGGGGKALAGIVTGGTAVGLSVVLFIVAEFTGSALQRFANSFPTPT